MSTDGAPRAQIALFVATHPPGGGSGSGLRARRTLEALRERFNRVDVVAMAGADEEGFADPSVILVPRPPLPPLPARIAALRYGGAYYAAERAAAPALARLPDQGLIERRYDLVWVAQSLLASATLQTVASTRRVIDIDNVAGADRRRSASDPAVPAATRFFRFMSSYAIATEERRRCNAFDRVVLPSAVEQARLGPVRPPIHLVPNTVEAAPLADALRAPNRLLFVGSLDYEPNVDAVRRLVGSILPRVRAAVSDVTLDVVGRNPTREVIDLCAAASIHLHADAPSLDPMYACARAVVAPLRLGGGTRLKVVEALARGAPVIATPAAAEGLSVDPTTDIVLAEHDDEFVLACIRLLTDPVAAASVGSAGYAVWDHNYRPEAARGAIHTLLDGLLV